MKEKLDNSRYQVITFVAVGIILFTMFLTFTMSNDAFPGHILYSVDRSTEDFEIYWAETTGGKVAKSEKYLELAEERLDELVAISNKEGNLLFPIVKINAQDVARREAPPGRADVIDTLAREYEENIDKALVEAEKANSIELAEKIAGATLKHQEVLLKVYDKVPDQAKKGILNAMEESSRGHERSLKTVSGRENAELKQNFNEKKLEIMQKVDEKKEDALKRRGDSG